MSKDMEELNKLFNELFDKNPELKEEMRMDDLWREQKKEEYISNGMSVNDAELSSWVDYWAMVKERDGVEFSINRLN